MAETFFLHDEPPPTPSTAKSSFDLSRQSSVRTRGTSTSSNNGPYTLSRQQSFQTSSSPATIADSHAHSQGSKAAAATVLHGRNISYSTNHFPRTARSASSAALSFASSQTSQTPVNSPPPFVRHASAMSTTSTDTASSSASTIRVSNGNHNTHLSQPLQLRPDDRPLPRDTSLLKPLPSLANLRQELRSVGEFAQEHLFSQFKTQANDKIFEYTARYPKVEISVQKSFGPNADPKFDQLLQAIGHSASRNPSSFIDKVTLWHREVVENAKVEPTEYSDEDSSNEAMIERKTSLAIFLLCRALLEILKQTSSHPLARPELDRLEQLIYNRHFRSLCRESTERTPVGQVKWDMITQVIVALFDLDFQAMADRVLADLKSFHRVLGIKGYNDRDAEQEITLFLKGLRGIRLRCDNDFAWSQSCKFLSSVADLFGDVHGQLPKEAYCRFIGVVLLPIAESSKEDFSQLQWRKLTIAMNERLNQLVGKPKYWQVAYPVISILACISPADIFASKFQSLTSAFPAKLRERHNRATAIKAICRLVWAYLDRTKDSQERIVETLKEIVRTVFFSGKRYSLSREPAIAEPLVQLIRVIGYMHPDLCFRSIIFPLMNRETVMSVKDVKEIKPDQLDPDKSVLGIRACLLIMSDLEAGTKPRFPVRFDDERNEDMRNWLYDGKMAEVGLPTPLNHAAKTEQLVMPVVVNKLPSSLRDFFLLFGDVLTKIVVACDAGFGGQAALDDRFAPSATPKTPMGGSFNRRDDGASAIDDRNAFFEALQVGIYALPRCLNGRPPASSILTLLCSGTAHIDPNIAFSAMHALKSIAKQGHSQVVIDRFSGFILNYDNRCSVVSIGANLGVTHIEHIIRLYVELLNIWTEDLSDKTLGAIDPVSGDDSKTENKIARLDTSSTWTQVDRVESQALFFLCSSSSRVRSSAVDILSLVTKLDAALGQENIRIMAVLKSISKEIMDPDDNALSLWERSKLQRELKLEDDQNPLIKICCSYHEQDRKLWYKVFPRFIEVVFRTCPVAVTQTREDVCSRLAQMQPLLENFDDNLRVQPQSGSIDMTINTRSGRSQGTSVSEHLIDQWKACLMFACKTITRTGEAQVLSLEAAHTRKSSKSSQSTQESFTTGTDLFQRIIPFLSAGNVSLRQATVSGLGSIGFTLLRPLLESLQHIGQGSEDHRGQPSTHHRQASSPRRGQSSFFSVETAEVHKLISHFLQRPGVVNDDWVMDYYASYVKELSNYLHRVENASDHSKLRLHYCGLVERFYVAITMTPQQEKWMTFQTRISAFTIMEDWTGIMRFHHAKGNESPPPHQQIHHGQGSRHVNKPQIIKEQKELRNAALSSMAALCAGPLSRKGTSSPNQFDVSRLMEWIWRMFNDASDSTPAIGRRALANILRCNPQHGYPLDRAIEAFYHARTTKCLDNYLVVVSSLLMSAELPPPLELAKILTALLFALTSTDANIRMTSARLLRKLDEQKNSSGSCELQDFDVSISDRTAAVYKKAHFDISTRLAEAYPEEAIRIFAEFSKQFRRLGSEDQQRTEDQRNFVHAILPWLKKIDLQLQPLGKPTPSSYMVMMNLLEITLNYSAPLQHEIQALWQTLVVGPHRGNVRLILDFTMDLTLDRKNASLVEVVRQIVVFLSETPAGEKLIDALLQQIVPAKMENDEKQKTLRVQTPPEASGMFAHIGSVPFGTTDNQHPWDMTTGQLSLILLVDLIVAPRKIPTGSIPPVLQAVLVLWDHKIPIVQEQAREMLVHLIHELVISQLNKTGAVPPHVEEFIDQLRRRDSKVLWGYNENERADKGFELSKPFEYVVNELISTFATIQQDIRSAWGTITMNWALNCRVLHLALRSLQIYRCIVAPLNEQVVGDLVRVLANLIADEEPERQSYAIEAMRTVRAVLLRIDSSDLAMFAPLFWVVTAALGVGHEEEYAEALAMLNIVLDKFDLSNTVVESTLMQCKPDKLTWGRGGLTKLLLPGCRSALRVESTLTTLDRLICIPSNRIVGNNDRLLFVVLANLPLLVQRLRFQSKNNSNAPVIAEKLTTVAASTDYHELASALEAFSANHGGFEMFARRAVRAIQISFFPDYEFESLIFVMGLLSNSLDGMQREGLFILDILTDEVNMANPDIPAAGPDLVSPLLRLVQTDLCQLALKVLDKFTAIVSQSIGKQQLHMSMADWRSSRSMRKQYDEAQSIFGIPEQSGWSVPMPGRLKAATRETLSVVASTCVGSSKDQLSSLPTPEVEFYKDDADGYFHERTITMTSDEATLAETSMGDLMTKLDGLDDWFADEDDDTIDSQTFLPSSSSNPTSFSRTGTFDSFNSDSDKMSMHTRSFQSSFSSNRAPTTPREPTVMSPSAFKASPPRHQQRPSMQLRTMTSPASPNQHHALPVDPRRIVESFSDDDLSMSGTTSDASSAWEGTHRAMAPRRPSLSLRQNVRSSFRKLTGSDKVRGLRPLRLTDDSPEVPKVPDVYLQQSRSPES